MWWRLHAIISREDTESLPTDKAVWTVHIHIEWTVKVKVGKRWRLELMSGPGTAMVCARSWNGMFYNYGQLRHVGESQYVAAACRQFRTKDSYTMQLQLEVDMLAPWTQLSKVVTACRRFRSSSACYRCISNQQSHFDITDSSVQSLTGNIFPSYFNSICAITLMYAVRFEMWLVTFWDFPDFLSVKLLTDWLTLMQ